MNCCRPLMANGALALATLMAAGAPALAGGEVIVGPPVR